MTKAERTSSGAGKDVERRDQLAEMRRRQRQLEHQHQRRNKQATIQSINRAQEIDD